MKAVPALALACATAPASSPVRQPATARAAPIDTLDLRRHTALLAHDSLGGRGTGSRGADLASAYIAAECRQLDLQPVGGDYFQAVPLIELSIRPGTTLTLERDSRQEFRHPQHFLPDFGTGGELASFSGPLVYVNTPVVPEALPELRGAIVTTLGPAGDSDVLALLKRRGAAGVLQLGADTRVFDLYSRSRGDTRLSLDDASIPGSLTPPIPVVVAGPALTRAALEGTPLASGAPRPKVSLRLDAARRPVASRNVACLLPGAAPRQRDTAITLTAHYDHLGLGAPDERGDSIYNGFSDNAAGVAMLLAIARAMREHAKPRHSVLFLFFTGEEQGLLGSDYYVARPLWPLARVRAVMNLDAGAPAARPASWRIAGGQGSPLGLVAVDVALTRGWSATTSAARANSDHFPFTRSGVPAIAIIPGPGPYEGLTTDSSESLRRRWDFYHQPGDEWSAEFPMVGLRRYAEYAYLIALALDRGLDAAEDLGGRRRDARR
jgi:hypothetical protein